MEISIKTSMKGLSIRVHEGNPQRKQKPPRAKAPRKECVKVEPQKQPRKQVIVETHLDIHVRHHLREFSAKTTAKDIREQMSPRKPKPCARKNRESRGESL